MDTNRLQIGYRRWFVLLFALTSPGATVLAVAATWSIASDAEDFGRVAVGLGLLWAIFLVLLIVPGGWYLLRILRGEPALQLDDRGVLWGYDWDGHVGIEWQEIARIGSLRYETAEYSDRLLLIEPKDPAIPARFSRVRRLMAWTSREMYGTPYVIGLRTLRIKDEELIGAIRARFDGEIDLTGIS